MRTALRSTLLVAFLAAAAIYINNTSYLASPPNGKPTLLAHRGMAQGFDTAALRNDTCTAERMIRAGHDYLENTIASMHAAFAAGADIVELDVHPTTDGRFAVFHDWTLDCRTNGSGVTRSHPMTYLKTLDVGYGYTADGGKTFPFRGKGVGLMPTLDEVLDELPNRRFLIHIKSRDVAEGKMLGRYLASLPRERRMLLVAYGADQPVAEIRRQAPDIRQLSRGSLQSCLLRYIGYGWTGLMPKECHHGVMLVPINIAPWLWGWPDRFLSRFNAVGTSIFVLGPYSGGEFSTGIDSKDDFDRLPNGYAGGIWTNRVELIAELTKASASQESP